MTIDGQEVELVTDFDTLRVGMIVWVKPCGRCGKTERCFLVRRLRGKILSSDGTTVEYGDSFEALPRQPCTAVGAVDAVGRKTVECGVVYRLVDRTMDAEHMMASNLTRVAKGSHV